MYLSLVNKWKELSKIVLKYKSTFQNVLIYLYLVNFSVLSQNFSISCFVAFAILNEQFRTLSTPASKQAHSSCNWVVFVFNDHNADFTTSSLIL